VNKPAAEDFLLTFSSEKVRALAALAQRRENFTSLIKKDKRLYSCLFLMDRLKVYDL